MKCSIMLHFISVFTVYESIRLWFLVYKGLTKTRTCFCVNNLPSCCFSTIASNFSTVLVLSFMTDTYSAKKEQNPDLIDCMTIFNPFNPGVASSIPAQSHTFVEIDQEIISMVFLPPSAESFKKGCCQLQAKVCA